MGEVEGQQDHPSRRYTQMQYVLQHYSGSVLNQEKTINITVAYNATTGDLAGEATASDCGTPEPSVLKRLLLDVGGCGQVSYYEDIEEILRDRSKNETGYKSRTPPNAVAGCSKRQVATIFSSSSSLPVSFRSPLAGRNHSAHVISFQSAKREGKSELFYVSPPSTKVNLSANLSLPNSSRLAPSRNNLLVELQSASLIPLSTRRSQPFRPLISFQSAKREAIVMSGSNEGICYGCRKSDHLLEDCKQKRRCPRCGKGYVK
ncbi:Uncharacterized protein Fot_21208 [Forsythia ovata]|uniref:CCHC-type domain-containing protein n=1 Tax=Forsythia ovata TaxID=205694 RepID=A0ABD1UUI8_9LAMI